MARLVECSPASDDELPRLDGAAKTRLSGNRSSKALPDKKELIPKFSSSASVTRKVRRLAGGSRAGENPLFLPWNADQENSSPASALVSPSRLPSRSRRLPPNGASNRPQHHASQSEQDSPPPISRRACIRRQKVDPLSNTESDQRSVEAAATLKPRTRGTTCSELEASRGPGQSAVGCGEKGQETQTGVLTQKTARTSDGEPHDADAAAATTDPEDSSVYQTAAEDTSDYSDDSGSEFEPEELSDVAAGERSTKQSPPHSRQREGMASRAPREEASSESFRERSANTKFREAVGASAGRDTPSDAPRLSDAPRQAPAPKTPQQEIIKPIRSTPGLGDSLKELRLQLQDFSDGEAQANERNERPISPSTPPPRDVSSRSLVSPRKMANIPQTPHRPSVDAFWSQDFVDDWNDRHSPRKALLGRETEVAVKSSPKKSTKKSFDARKRLLAEEFFRELDAEITAGKISELAESTGGVKLVWTKALNTTAGRANWRRETTRTKLADGTLVAVSHRHYASIELADKVINDDDRLLNVLAHEFCHLANFMISGVTNNPHGKEFRSWAAKCSQAFGDSRGIRVTTRHTYEIDFKYVWGCTTCGCEYKRHSKSIDPRRHRCGSCKGALEQTKPAPRGAGATGKGRGKPSEYQAFVKEQMKIVRGENPGSPQKEVMRIVAEKWAGIKQGLAAASDETGTGGGVDGVVSRMVDLTLQGRDTG